MGRDSRGKCDILFVFEFIVFYYVKLYDYWLLLIIIGKGGKKERGWVENG